MLLERSENASVNKFVLFGSFLTILGLSVLAFTGLAQAGTLSESTGQALLQVTPAGGLNASTYSNGAFKIKNDSAGGQNIESVSVDLSTAILPDVVFDPNGTAGDATAKCFTANSDASTVGLATDGSGSGDASCKDPFSKPHDGKVEDGYDALKVDFNDFGPGETFAFSTDVDPTSIKGDPDAGGAGSVSGLELTGATVTVVFSDGTNNTTQTYRVPASDGGSQAMAKDGNIAKPTLSANGSTEAQTVADPNQTVKVEGPAGSQVSLLAVESGLFVKSGGGYDIDPYEANSAVKITEKNIVIGQDGTANVPATLTDSAEKAGLNYIVAVIEKDGRTGPNSNVLILELGENAQNAAPEPAADKYDVDQDSVLTVDAPGVLGNDTDANDDALKAKLGQGVENGTLKLNDDGSFTYTPNEDFTGTDTFTYVASDGQADSQEVTVTISVNEVTDPVNQAKIEIDPSNNNIGGSTYNSGSFKITNTGNQLISKVSVDLSTAILPDMVFDPVGSAGDKLGKCFTANSGASAVGLATSGDGEDDSSCKDPFTQPRDGGYDVLNIDFNDFGPGETFTFSTDVDPTSIKGDPGTGKAGSVSGLELAGTTTTVVFGDDLNNELVAQTYRLPESNDGSQSFVKAELPDKPVIKVLNVDTQPTSLSNGAEAATVANKSQTVRINGPEASNVSLLILESRLAPGDAPNGGFDLEKYEANEAVKLTEYSGTVGPQGYADINVELTRTEQDGKPDGGLNYMAAVIKGAGGATGPNSNVLVLELDESQQHPPDQDTTAPSVTPESMSFGKVQVGKSAPKDVVLKNPGTEGTSAIVVNSAEISGAPAFSRDFQGPLTLKPGESKTVKVHFAPKETGLKKGELVFQHDGAGEALIVPLSGTGTAKPGGCTMIGTPGDDTLRGTRGDDVICGLGGNDTIYGLDGNDALKGGPGANKLVGGNGNDTLTGGNGKDTAYGQNGNDRVTGLGGNDTLKGGSGTNGIVGGDGNDRLVGGNAVDKIFGQNGNDTLIGLNGNDYLRGDSGRDRLYGNSGRDRLSGKDGVRGNDYLNGGRGRDQGGADPRDRIVGIP